MAGCLCPLRRVPAAVHGWEQGCSRAVQLGEDVATAWTGRSVPCSVACSDWPHLHPTSSLLGNVSQPGNLVSLNTKALRPQTGTEAAGPESAHCFQVPVTGWEPCQISFRTELPGPTWSPAVCSPRGGDLRIFLPVLFCYPASGLSTRLGSSSGLVTSWPCLGVTNRSRDDNRCWPWTGVRL